MGWFDEQIKLRKAKDEETFENAFADLSSVVLGNSALSMAFNDDRQRTESAIGEVLNYFGVKIEETHEEFDDMNEQLDYLLYPSGIMYREVNLRGDWYKDAIGPMIGQTTEGTVVALIPKGMRGYEYFDYKTGQKVKLNKNTNKMLTSKALCFYKPFPQKKLKLRDLSKYILSILSLADYIMIVCAALVSMLLGLLPTYIQQLLYGKVLASGKMSLLLPISALLIGILVSTTLIDITKSFIISRVGTKLNIAVEAASMARLMSLPPNFFKNYAAGDLSQRIDGLNQICAQLADVFLGTGLTAIFSLGYVAQIATIAPSLTIPSLCVIFTTVVFNIWATLVSLKIYRKKMNIAVKLSGIVYSLFSGIQKIKLAGAEKRAFSKWATQYKSLAELTYNPPMIIKIQSIISVIISAIGGIIICYFAGISNVNVANYMAYMTAYGNVFGAVSSLAGIALTFANIRVILEMVGVIMETEPEISEKKKVVRNISGAIEINNVSFRYADDMPLILDNLSLKIEPGQYIAVVGKTGCGKSTLMRLLLGFEKPQKGAIYYDGRDISSVDIKSLRKNIGVVMQNADTFSGDIYSNITVSAPWLSLDDAWNAAKIAGIDKEIEDMPMGMYTVISEGSGGISGGQKQRLMIARAVAPKPKILILDEATSALDNITQKQVSDALAELKSTRIVVAHRLSTIKQCDRIIVLDAGKIIEDGTYDELIDKNGFFAELVRRQRADISNKEMEETVINSNDVE